MNKKLVAALFLFSGAIPAETDYPGDFYKALAAAGANIEVDALDSSPQRLAFILETWRSSGGRVAVKHFNKPIPANNGQPMPGHWLIEIARKYGGRITFED
jgi:hypothetical protein